LQGYKIYYGLGSRLYTETVDVGNVTEWPIPNEWPNGLTYYFAATAYGNCWRCPEGMQTCDEVERVYWVCESGYSNEVFYLKESQIQPASGVAVALALVEADVHIRDEASAVIADEIERGLSHEQ
jgi:hypothetical protein